MQQLQFRIISQTRKVQTTRSPLSCHENDEATKSGWHVCFQAVGLDQPTAASLHPRALLLFGARMEEWATTLLGDRRTAALAFGAVALLLVADVALPIPSSVVSTMGGAMLGAPLGAAASWVGMTAGSVFGYALGAFAGRGLLRRLVEPVSVVALERDLALYGVGLIAVGRAVPVVAEATTIIAGASRMEFCRFFLVSAVANLGISIVYATVGALSAHIGSFLLAVAGSVTLPAIAWWLVVKRRSKADTPLGGGSGSK